MSIISRIHDAPLLATEISLIEFHGIPNVRTP